MSAEQAFRAVMDAQLQHPGVATARMFGAVGLGVRGKYFCMLYKGKLVVKLPRERVDSLVANGYGERFDPGHGRIMREWLAVGSHDAGDWMDLAEEARRFVARGT